MLEPDLTTDRYVVRLLSGDSGSATFAIRNSNVYLEVHELLDFRGWMLSRFHPGWVNGYSVVLRYSNYKGSIRSPI